MERIPETLGDAIEAFEHDGFMRDVLGEHIFIKYLEAKKKEWREFRAQVTDWEVSEYLYKYCRLCSDAGSGGETPEQKGRLTGR